MGMKALHVTAGARLRKESHFRGPDTGADQLGTDQRPEVEHRVSRIDRSAHRIQQLGEADPESLPDG